MGTIKCSSIVENVFRRSGSLRRLRAELSVYYWPKVAGAEIAKNVHAVRYFNGYLYLKTENPTLAHQLMMMNIDILKRYRFILGPDVLKGIRVKIGSIEHVCKKNEDNHCIALKDSEKEYIEENCQRIHDVELAERFKRIMQKFYTTQHKLEADGAHRCASCDVIIDKAYSYCPVCEIKLKEEIASYIGYLKKHNQEVKINALPLNLDEANEQLIRKMLKY